MPLHFTAWVLIGPLALVLTSWLAVRLWRYIIPVMFDSGDVQLSILADTTYDQLEAQYVAHKRPQSFLEFLDSIDETGPIGPRLIAKIFSTNYSLALELLGKINKEEAFIYFAYHGHLDLLELVAGELSTNYVIAQMNEPGFPTEAYNCIAAYFRSLAARTSRKQLCGDGPTQEHKR